MNPCFRTIIRRARRTPIVRLLSALLLLSACTTTVPKKELPFPLTNKNYDDQVKMVTIPLPAISSNPNEGITAGALAAFLLHDRNDDVAALLAPQVNYNKYFGVTGSFYGGFYASPERYWEVNLSHSTKVNMDYEYRIRDRTFFDNRLETNLFAFRIVDGAARFFGFQSESRKSNESNYADDEYGITLSLGYELLPHLQLVVGERFRKAVIGAGAVTSLPDIHDKFSEKQVPGINGFTAHAQKLAMVYNTLDSLSMPTSGIYLKGTIEANAQFMGSSADYRHYETEAKGYLSLGNARYITVGRLVYNQTLGSDVPFLERSILGGENTLRGYGRNRFVDSSYILCNIEERIRLFRWEIFNVNADWELAPFIDLGAVMESLDKVIAKNFQFSPGLGFRATVRPNVVGRVDVGFGKEGPAVFVGLGYPF